MPSFDRGGFQIYYELHGTGEATPLLYIMGMGATCQGWLVLQVPELSRERPNLIFDNRGAGQSGDPGEDFTTRDLARDAVALLDALGIERAHVLGAFLGGMAAQELAIEHPERVQSLTLVGTFARADARRRMLLELWRDMADSLPYELVIKSRLLWTLHDPAFEQRDILDAMLQFYLERDAPLESKVYARQIRACLDHDTLERLDRITAPTLVVCGEHDLVTPPSLARELSQHIPSARLVPIAGAGHLVPVEMARRFNRLVARFLAEHD